MLRLARVTAMPPPPPAKLSCVVNALRCNSCDFASLGFLTSWQIWRSHILKEACGTLVMTLNSAGRSCLLNTRAWQIESRQEP